MIFVGSSGHRAKYSGCRSDHSHHTLFVGHAMPYTSCPKKKMLYMFLTSDAVFLTMSSVMEDEQVLVPSTQCLTNAQSSPNVGSIDVNPELPVNARIESRSLTLEANLGELQRLVKVRNSSGVTPLIVTSGTTTVVIGFAGNNHGVGQLHAYPDKGTTATIGQRDKKN
ncbi:hypothetical protein AHAS_Ahas10G0067100 [Arachis hypogaea]